MDLHGWDVVSVMPILQLNTLLAQNQSRLIGDISSSIHAGLSGDKSIAGKISNWQLQAGKIANQTDVNITLSADLEIASASGFAMALPAHYDIEITLPLSFRVSEKDKDVRELCFNFKSENGKVPATEDVQVHRLNDAQLTELVQLAIFNNYDRMSFVFASVNTVLKDNKFGAFENPFFYFYTDRYFRSYFIVAGSAGHAVGEAPVDPILFTENLMIGISRKLILQYGLLPQLRKMSFQNASLVHAAIEDGHISLSFRLHNFGHFEGFRADASGTIDLDDDKMILELKCDNGQFHMAPIGLGDRGGTDYRFSFDWTYSNPTFFNPLSQGFAVSPDPAPNNPPAALSAQSYTLASIFELSCAKDQIVSNIKNMVLGDISFASIPIDWYDTGDMRILNAGFVDNAFMEFEKDSTWDQNIKNYWVVLVNKHSGKVLDIDGGSFDQGGNAVQWEYNGTSNQRFALVETEPGYYMLLNKKSRLVLDVDSQSTANGARLHQWVWLNADNQKFKIEEVETGYVKFTNKHSKSVFDIDGGSLDNRASVHQWNWCNGDNQKFRVIPVEKISDEDLTFLKGFQSFPAFTPDRLTQYWCVLMNGACGKVLGIDESSPGQEFLKQSNYSGNDYQKFHLALRTAPDRYTIANKQSGLLLQPQGLGLNKSNGAVLQQFIGGIGDSVEFIVTQTDEPGFYKFTNSADGMVIDFDSNSLRDGGKVQLWQWCNYRNQKFMVIPVESYGP